MYCAGMPYVWQIPLQLTAEFDIVLVKRCSWHVAHQCPSHSSCILAASSALTFCQHNFLSPVLPQTAFTAACGCCCSCPSFCCADTPLYDKSLEAALLLLPPLLPLLMTSAGSLP